MASKIVLPRFVFYRCKQHQHLLKQIFRTFSSKGKNEKCQVVTVYIDDKNGNFHESDITWPDPSLGCLVPGDRRLPLPGNTGVPPVVNQNGLPLKRSSKFGSGNDYSSSGVGITVPLTTNHEKQLVALTQYLNIENEIADVKSEDIGDLISQISSTDTMECVPFDCPKLLRKDLALLFPNRDIMMGYLTVVTISQSTKNDMMTWSEEMETEREHLTECFVESCRTICNDLIAKGYWADFIDPASGRPFLGPPTNATFFETDERYRYFGLKIEDLGCCKVVSHRLWGTKTFVGSLFTNVPSNSPILEQVIQKNIFKFG